MQLSPLCDRLCKLYMYTWWCTISSVAGERLSKNDWYWLKEDVGRNKWTIIDHYGIAGEYLVCIILYNAYCE